MVVLVALFVATAAGQGGPWPDMLAASGVHGGLVVHLNCGDATRTTGLRAGGRYLVRGLDGDAQRVAQARRHIRSLGLYGTISVDQFDGRHLPFVDNVVNLIVASSPCRVSAEELARVLAPGGVVLVEGPPAAFPALMRQSPRGLNGWSKLVKRIPPEIDQWTHYLHGPDNNSVAEDTVVGPPRHMQWLAGPKWTRHHHADKGSDPTIRAVVSANGRLFTMVDEATAANIAMPSQWVLLARDAFSGVQLWKRPLRTTKFERRLERVWRTLITDGHLVYAPLGEGEALSALDAATGETVRSYAETEHAEEVILDDGTLFVVTGGKRIVALSADTGQLLWQWDSEAKTSIVPLTLAAARGKVFVKTDEDIRCLSAKTGENLWRFVPQIAEPRTRLKWPRARLVVSDDVVLCSYGGKSPQMLNRDKWDYLGSHPPVRDYGGTLAALSAADGRRLWETAYRPGLESFPGAVYVIDGLVWCGPDFAQGFDLHTGEVKRDNSVLAQLWTSGHHNRCYPEKATSRFVLTSKRGIELIDLKGDNHSRNNWVRATCRVGVLPCNGLIYTPPHSCGCYMEAQLYGFWALASAERAIADPGSLVGASRLQPGPAFGTQRTPRAASATRGWPTYRRDSRRSGATSVTVASELERKWKTPLGGPLSATTVVDGRVFVAQVDAHTVHALNAENGRTIWSFTAGGRVDSPPTIHRGLVLFGSRDGWVYCLRVADGEQVWRFLAASHEINSVAFGQVESVWPVHGSVLVDGGVAYVAAGRSSYLDGGIALYGLEPETGKVLCQTQVASEHATATPLPPEDEQLRMSRKIKQNDTDYKTFLAPDRSDAFSMTGATTDVLVAERGSVFLRQMRFDAQLARQEEKLPHLFSTSSLLDDTENHRSHWVFGTGNFSRTPVAYSWIANSRTVRHGTALAVPYGMLLVVGDKVAWGIQRSHLMRSNKGKKSRYALFAQHRSDLVADEQSLPDFRAQNSPRKWITDMPLRPRAMVRAGDTLLVGGMPDTIDPNDASAPGNAEFMGKGRGLLRVVSCDDGTTRSEHRIDSPPVWDGMAAAGGRLYLSTQDGHVICLGP